MRVGVRLLRWPRVRGAALLALSHGWHAHGASGNCFCTACTRPIRRVPQQPTCMVAPRWCAQLPQALLLACLTFHGDASRHVVVCRPVRLLQQRARRRRANEPAAQCHCVCQPPRRAALLPFSNASGCSCCLAWGQRCACCAERHGQQQRVSADACSSHCAGLIVELDWGRPMGTFRKSFWQGVGQALSRQKRVQLTRTDRPPSTRNML